MDVNIHQRDENKPKFADCFLLSGLAWKVTLRGFAQRGFEKGGELGHVSMVVWGLASSLWKLCPHFSMLWSPLPLVAPVRVLHARARSQTLLRCVLLLLFQKVVLRQHIVANIKTEAFRSKACAPQSKDVAVWVTATKLQSCIALWLRVHHLERRSKVRYSNMSVDKAMGLWQTIWSIFYANNRISTLGDSIACFRAELVWKKEICLISRFSFWANPVCTSIALRAKEIMSLAIVSFFQPQMSRPVPPAGVLLMLYVSWNRVYDSTASGGLALERRKGCWKCDFCALAKRWSRLCQTRER